MLRSEQASSVRREYHDRNPAALSLVGTVQGFLPGFTRTNAVTVFVEHICGAWYIPSTRRVFCTAYSSQTHCRLLAAIVWRCKARVVILANPTTIDYSSDIADSRLRTIQRGINLLLGMLVRLTGGNTSLAFLEIFPGETHRH